MIRSLLVGLGLAQINNSVMDATTTIYCNPEESRYTLLLKDQASGSKSLYGQLDPGGCQDSVSDGSYGSYYICDYLGNDTLVNGFCQTVLGGTDVEVILTDEIKAYGWSNYGQWVDTKSIACEFRDSIDCWWHWQIKAGDTTPECEKSASCEDWQANWWTMTIAGQLTIMAITLGSLLILLCASGSNSDRSSDNCCSGCDCGACGKCADCCCEALAKIICFPCDTARAVWKCVPNNIASFFRKPTTMDSSPLVDEYICQDPRESSVQLSKQEVNLTVAEEGGSKLPQI